MDLNCAGNAPPDFLLAFGRGQKFDVTLIGQIASLEQYRRHVGCLEHDKRGKPVLIRPKPHVGARFAREQFRKIR